MEKHHPDPTSELSEDPWGTVTSELSSLGQLLKHTYRQVASDAGPSEEEIKDALATLAGAWDQVAASLSSALHDPDTRAHLRKTAGSLAAALGATMSGLGEELDDAKGRVDRDDPEPDQGLTG